jgi:hypothetical protein
MGSLLCCCCRRKVADEADPVFVDTKDRKCTDVLFCLLFIVFWIGMIIIAGFAFRNVRSVVSAAAAWF